tara:strand:+ start:40 stop:261 length:222 start_codon:yes stop_codon:yes gene_type:complete
MFSKIESIYLDCKYSKLHSKLENEGKNIGGRIGSSIGYYSGYGLEKVIISIDYFLCKFNISKYINNFFSNEKK